MPKKKKNGTVEKIHGKKVKIGKGVGERAAKRAVEALKEKNRRLRALLYET